LDPLPHPFFTHSIKYIEAVAKRALLHFEKEDIRKGSDFLEPLLEERFRVPFRSFFDPKAQQVFAINRVDLDATRIVTIVRIVWKTD
jgi:hypothetical protein